MADITMSSPAAVTAPAQNTLGIQFVARGTITDLAEGAPGCDIRLQNNPGIPLTPGAMYVSGTNWMARFAPLYGFNNPPYQVVANAPTQTAVTSVTVSQVWFDSTITIAITGNRSNPWPRSFTVSGTYSSDPTYTVDCNLFDRSGTLIANSNVSYQNGQWQARFNLTSAAPNCWLLVELFRTSAPVESIAAAWIDGINIP
jgi:hypothetical protein